MLRHNKVCALARLNGTGHISYSGQLCVAQGRRVEGELIAHTAILMEIAQLPPEIILGDVGTAHVIAQAHRDAVGKRGLCAFHHAVKHDLAVVLILFRGTGNRCIEQRIGQRRGDGRAQEGSPLLIQADRLIVHLCTVLDGIHPIFQRHLHALRRFGVCCYGVAQPVGFVANGFDHLRLHFQLSGRSLFRGIQHTAGDHQLDKIHLLTAGLSQLSQRFGIVMGRNCHRARHVSPGHRNAFVGGKNARCKQSARSGIITAASVKIRNAAHGTDGSHATQQFQLRVAVHQPVGHRTGQAIAQNFAHQRSIVPRLCAGLAVARQMHMQIDQTRHDIAAVQIDDLIAIQIHALIGNGSNLIILGQQDFVRYRLHLLGAIQQDPVRIGTFHWEHPLFFRFFRTGVVLFQYSTFRQMVQCKNGQERFSPLLPA